MLRNLTTVATIGMLMASSALAQCSTPEKGCCAKNSKAMVLAAQTKKADASATCTKGMPAELVMMQKIAKHGGPKMAFKIGDKDTCCPMTAEKMAKEAKTDMQFIVGETTYMTKGEAKLAYATELERYLEDLTTISYAIGEDCTRCPMTAKKMAGKSGKSMHYRLGSFDFQDMAKAKALAASARKAAEEVQLATMVGDKKYTCSTTAGKMAKEHGKSVEYAVSGMKTTCSKTADLNLKLAKVDAALNTIAAAQG